jgi:hypothetical protein
MDADRPSPPTFGPPQDEAFNPADPFTARQPEGDGPGVSRKVLFGLLAVIAVVFAFGSAWVGYQYANTSAIDRLGKSVAAPATPARPAAPSVPPISATPAPPAAAPLARANEPATAPLARTNEPATAPGGMGAGPSAPPALPSAEELLAARKAPQAPAAAPDALVRDLPDWLATEVGGRPRKTAPVPQTSGGSADESADRRVGAPAARVRPAERQERAAAVFARCPKPGESGAVECRRAVCSGAARKQGACAAYVN